MYAPRRPQGLLGSRVQADGATLAWGRGGERWLFRSNDAEAAGDLAPEELIGLALSNAGALRFVGRSGTMYEAASALAPFTRVVATHVAASTVAASGTNVAVVGHDGELTWSRDGGETWKRIALDAHWVTDVRIDGERGVVLGLPERLFSTADGGATFSRLVAPTVGASRLITPRAGVVSAIGYQSAIEISGDSVRTVDAAERAAEPSLAVQLRSVVDAGDLARGRGFIWKGTAYVAVTTREKAGMPLGLGRAKLGERLDITPLAGTERCQDLALAGDDRALYAACTVTQRGSGRGRIKILRYTNTAEAPEELAGALEGSAATRLALGPADQLIVWGACRRTQERCDIDTPLWLGQWETAVEGVEPEGSPWGATRAPALAGGVLDVKFAGRGAVAYLIGRRAKSGELGLFVSKDAGRTFEPRELSLSAGAPPTNATLSVIEPGVVTVAMEGPTPEVVLADEDGRALSSGSPPVKSAGVRLGVAGRRALAVAPTEAWESADAGVSWTSLGEVGALRCPDSRPCSHPVSCTREGCVVGAKVSRIGWGGEASAPREMDGEPPPPPSRTLGTSAPPVVCRLRKDKWVKLPPNVAPPGAGDAERGRWAFATFAVDRTTTAVTMIHGSAAGRIEEAQLLPKLAKADGVAVVALPQVEGAAAMRFVTREPSAKPEVIALGRRGDLETAQPSAIEVAWENLFEGKLSRATLRPTPPITTSFGDSPDPGPAREARPALLSISAGGIYVRPAADDSAEIFFIDHAGKVERSAYAAWPTKTRLGEPLQVNADAVRVGTTTVPFAIARSAARTTGNNDQHAATGLLGRGRGFGFAIAPAKDGALGLDTHTSFSYAGGAPLLVVETQHAQSGAWDILTFPFRADGVVGDAKVAPTQARAIEKPRVCTADDRAKTPRIVAPAETGTRRAVLIEGPDGSRFAALASSTMVLFGTDASPCQAALDANPSRNLDPGEESFRALVSFGEQSGWLFRGAKEIEARPMTCRVDPKAEVPQELSRDLDGSANGTTKRTRK